MLRAGDLKNRVTIRRPGEVQDGAGQPIPGWIDVASVWANIRHPNGAESIRGDREISVVRASIRIRRRTDVTSAMRVYFGETAYQIKAVLPDEVGRVHTDLTCEVVNG